MFLTLPQITLIWDLSELPGTLVLFLALYT